MCGSQTGRPFDAGWNDIAHGILTWAPHERWASALEWALHCREVAVACGARGYYAGCIACVDAYQKTGRISRR